MDVGVCRTGMHASRSDFGPGRGAPALARRFIRDFLMGTGADARCRQVAELLASELVTNAVTHASSTARLSAELDDGSARIAITDDGPGRLRLREPDDGGGYGLWLVDWLARSWGWDRTGRGKTVWFTVPLQSGDEP